MEGVILQYCNEYCREDVQSGDIHKKDLVTKSIVRWLYNSH